MEPTLLGRNNSGSQIRIENREDLIFILSEASTLEHMVMCEYLFAAFSLKRGTGEGLTSDQFKAVTKWERVISDVATQEMLHLSLVNNMLTAIGAAPYFGRPNFPHPSNYFPPSIQLVLLPFGEEALRQFLYLERPDGMAIEGVPGWEAIGALPEKETGTGIVPEQQYFSTIGNLYRGIEQGFSTLVKKYGEKRVFIGGKEAQATSEYFGWPELIPVTDLQSATKAVEAIGRRYPNIALAILKKFKNVIAGETVRLCEHIQSPPVKMEEAPVLGSDPQTAIGAFGHELDFARRHAVELARHGTA